MSVAAIQADFEAGCEHRTTDGIVARLERGAFSKRLILRVKPAKGPEEIGRAWGAKDAAEAAWSWIQEMRGGRG